MQVNAESSRAASNVAPGWPNSNHQLIHEYVVSEADHHWHLIVRDRGEECSVKIALISISFEKSATALLKYKDMTILGSSRVDDGKRDHKVIRLYG